jgi:hypothetical protein
MEPALIAAPIAGGVFAALFGFFVVRLSGIYLAMLGGSAKADEWTAEQVSELKAHDLTAALWYSPPTTNPYRDLNTAVSAGEIDARTSYSVTLGDARMVSSKALYSANEYLARRYSVKVEGTSAECDKEGALKKPKFVDLLNPKASWFPKVLSARTKLNAIDDLMFPIYKDFILGGGVDGLTVASDPGAIATKVAELDARIEEVYDTKVRPVAFYLGATGLIPEGWQVEVLDAEALKARFPSIDVEKKQLDGTFFVSADAIVGVFSEVAYFSTPLGVAKARVLEIA